jgi:hypothetical protein
MRYTLGMSLGKNKEFLGGCHLALADARPSLLLPGARTLSQELEGIAEGRRYVMGLISG